MATKLQDMDIGSIVQLNVGGVATNFIVVHQGKPSSVYDNSCDGTWLLIENIYTKRAWDSTDNDYENSDIHTYLNDTFLGLLDKSIQNAALQAKIPYTKGTGNGTVLTGSNGLSTKIFLLSATELGLENNYINVEGAVLDYFNGISDSDRVRIYSGSKTSWWSRSPMVGNKLSVNMVSAVSGTASRNSATYTHGICPALILPSTFTLSTISGKVNIDGVSNELFCGYVNIDGTWKELSGTYINIDGTWKEKA